MKEDKIIENLLLFDEEISKENFLPTKAQCYIVGGSAFILSGMDGRSTRDIDVLDIDIPKDEIVGLSSILKNHSMNRDVQAYFDKFPSGFARRSTKLDLDTKSVDFYILSVEDLVISKLCTTRFSQDVTDIEDPFVINKIDWDKLDELAKSMAYTMVSHFAYDNFLYQYNNFVERFRGKDERDYD